MAKKLKVVDLFAGTRSIAKAFEARGHETFSIELDRQYDNIDWYVDILDITAEDILERFGQPDIVWASPPCKNGDTCHVAASRDSSTGTQGIKGSVARSVIPEQLCEHIAIISEEGAL